MQSYCRPNAGWSRESYLSQTGLFALDRHLAEYSYATSPLYYVATESRAKLSGFWIPAWAARRHSSN